MCANEHTDIFVDGCYIKYFMQNWLRVYLINSDFYGIFDRVWALRDVPIFNCTRYVNAGLYFSLNTRDQNMKIHT